MRMYTRRLVGCMVTLGLLVFLAGCSRDDTQAILDLVSLQGQLLAEYRTSNIVLGLEDRNTLGVTVVDDSSGGLARAQRAEQAREIAEFVCQNYASMGSIDRVWVAIELRQEGFMADVTGSATFSFEKGELECSGS